jgi:hypothetical protein
MRFMVRLLDFDGFMHKFRERAWQPKSERGYGHPTSTIALCFHAHSETRGRLSQGHAKYFGHVQEKTRKIVTTPRTNKPAATFSSAANAALKMVIRSGKC